MSQDSHKVLEVHLVIIPILALIEECVHNPVPKRVDGQLRNTEEILSAEETFVLLVKTREPTEDRTVEK